MRKFTLLGEIMIEEQLQNFIHFLRFEKRYSSHTVTAYTTDIEQFRVYLSDSFGLEDLKLVTHFHIRSWLAAIKDDKQTARTINRKMASLSALYKYLMKTGVLEKNPVRQLHAQRLPERLPVYLKEKETEFLLTELQFEEGFKGMTDKLICELLYDTGIRRNELLLLKESDVVWSRKQIRILGKGNKERLIPVSEVLLDTIRTYIEEKKHQPYYDATYLLNLQNGMPVYAMYIYRIVNQYLALTTTQKKKSPHVLRHTFATHLLNNGANIQAIKDLLGHSSLAATQIYTHNNIDKLKEIHRQNHPRG